MRTNTKRQLLLSVSLLAGLAVAAEAAAQVDTITVTARKKSENVQNVPISITAFNGDMLGDLGVEDLSDVAKFAPNVSFDGTAATSGSTIASTVYIRGVGQTDFTLNSDPGVGVYIDGVYVARSVGGLLDLIDVESVEVLRGPQGTLFGKNTIGGAINVTSRRPDPDGGGYIELQGGNFARANLKAGFDFPINETVVANIAGAYLSQDGYQDRILLPDEPALGDINRFILRGRLNWNPIDAFEADLNIDVTRVREESVPQTILEVEPNTGGAPFLTSGAGTLPGSTAQFRPGFEGLFPGTALIDGTYLLTSEDGASIDPRRSYYAGPSRSDADIVGAALTLSYDLGAVQIKSISAYREVLSDFARDLISSPVPLATVDSYDQNQFSQEIQLLGELANGRLDYVIGGYLLSEEGENSNLVVTTLGDLLSGGSVDNRSLAAFAQTNIRITESLTLTAGLRYTDETKRFDPGYRGGEQEFIVSENGASVGAAGSFPLPPIPGFSIPLIAAPETLGLGQFYENSDDKLDRTIALHYAASEDINLYASYSTGFKAGGFSQRIGPGPDNPIPAPDFSREDVSAYEIGFKSLLMEKTLRLNGAAFFSDYKDLQVTPIFEGIGPVTRNLGDAEMWGVELEWSFAPNENFEWTGGLGYLHDEITSLTAVALTNIELDGTQILTLDSQLPKTPEFSASSTFAYTAPIDEARSITFRGNWSFSSEMFNDVQNSQVLLRDDLHLFGASVTLNWGDWRASFTGNNLTNKEYIIAGNDETAQGTFGYTQAHFARPREWWFTLRREF